MKFNNQHLKQYGEKSIDFSLLAVGGLVFGQFISENEVSRGVIAVGVILSIAGMVASYYFMRPLDEKEEI